MHPSHTPKPREQTNCDEPSERAPLAREPPLTDSTPLYFKAYCVSTSPGVTLGVGSPVKPWRAMTIPADTSLALHPQAFSPASRPSAFLASTATRRLLTKYVARRVPASEVEDVVQATLCDAIASARTPSDAGDLHRWLLAIARFKVADAHRAVARLFPGPADAGEIPAPSSQPLEAQSLATWAEQQLPPGGTARRTLQWMLREAEGDKLESIAADEQLPAERVRQRVSRLRRFMRERWIAELAAALAAGLIAAFGARSLAGRDEIILPEVIAEPSTDEARLRGSWRLVSFEPSQPLSVARQALFNQLSPTLVVTFDGRFAQATARDGSFERAWGVALSNGGRLELVDAKDQRTMIDYAREGDDLVIKAESGPWAGVSRFRAISP